MAPTISPPLGCTLATCIHMRSQVWLSMGKPLLLTWNSTPPSLSSSSEPPLVARLTGRAWLLRDRVPLAPLGWGQRWVSAAEPVMAGPGRGARGCCGCGGRGRVRAGGGDQRPAGAAFSMPLAAAGREGAPRSRAVPRDSGTHRRGASPGGGGCGGCCCCGDCRRLIPCPILECYPGTDFLLFPLILQSALCPHLPGVKSI